MTVKRYGVLDANGVKINTITADDALLQTDWYPGYGAYLIDEGIEPVEPPPAPPPTKPATFDQVIPALKQPMQNGDQLDVKSGTVTPAPIQANPVADQTSIDPSLPATP